MSGETNHKRDTDEAERGIERRHVLVLLNRWRDICGERALPGRTEATAETMGEIWPRCFVLAVPDGGGEPTFTYFGAELANWFGTDHTGQERAAVAPGGVLDHATEYYNEVLEEGVPVSHVGDFNYTDGYRYLYRSILLPLGYMADDGETEIVDGILGIVTYRYE